MKKSIAYITLCLVLAVSSSCGKEPYTKPQSVDAFIGEWIVGELLLSSQPLFENDNNPDNNATGKVLSFNSTYELAFLEAIYTVESTSTLDIEQMCRYHYFINGQIAEIGNTFFEITFSSESERAKTDSFSIIIDKAGNLYFFAGEWFSILGLYGIEKSFVKESNPQTISEVDETAYNTQERSLDPFGVKYPYLQSTGISTVSEEINTEIYTFLSDYCSSFTEGSEFNLEYKIMRNDDELISVLFSGSVFTPAKAIAQAFAMNFDTKSGKLMALDDFFTEKEILDELGAGNFDIDYGEESEYTVAPEIAFDIFRTITGDENHKFDFFFDTAFLYILVARDAPYGYYAIYKKVIL